MRAQNVVRLVVLAAIWGASFLFMRIVVGSLGPMTTACSRVLIAGIVLCAWFRATCVRVGWRAHWKRYAVIGIVNSAIPFSLYAFAARHIPGGYSAVINATAPAFGMILGAMVLGARPMMVNVIGAVVGFVGVGVMAGLGPVELGSMQILAVCACAGAALCYAIAGVYMKCRGADLNPVAIAGASQLIAGLVLIPGALMWPPTGPFTPTVIGAALALAFLCSGAAYLLYYRLIADCGPTRALTVTYLIPIFGVVWGAVFLGEMITVPMVAGCGLVVVGTMLVIRKPSPAQAAQ